MTSPATAGARIADDTSSRFQFGQRNLTEAGGVGERVEAAVGVLDTVDLRDGAGIEPHVGLGRAGAQPGVDGVGKPNSLSSLTATSSPASSAVARRSSSLTSPAQPRSGFIRWLRC